MSNTKIQIDQLSSEISLTLQKYSTEVAQEMKGAAQETAKKGREMIREISPLGKGSKKGHYKEGWKVKRQSETGKKIGIVIHNSKKPGLTHLLENGHAKRNGGRVEGIPHISKAADFVADEYEKRLKRRL